MESDREMIEDVTTLGIRAAVLLRGVMVRKVNRETLEWGLRELNPSEALQRYFPRLVECTEYVDLLNILHLLYGLEGQLDYQIREYGFDSLKDDLAEINFSLNQIGEKFDLPQVQQVM
ncbi:MAG: hypothetical protein HZB55_02680 [Deltaproteobacteria bacterium]|nr:hypothetical protein [Deltaproteobacteria bacterium]